MSRTKLLQDADGNASSARAIGIFVIVNAVLIVWASVIFGFFHSDQFAASVGVGAGTFTGMTTATFVYLYSNKKAEIGKELQDKGVTPEPPNT